MKNNQQYQRYHRQIILNGFGEAAQAKLSAANILMVGAGGLGSSALAYLAAAGIGTIVVIDDDKVALHNLHRQILYKEQDVGRPKAEIAVKALCEINSTIKYQFYSERLTNKNAAGIVEMFDLVLDGSDNFATRYLVNDVCVLLKKPFVYGAIAAYAGQLAVFNYEKGLYERPVNYRDLFPKPLQENDVMNCGQQGVLGVLPGIIGSMMANEAIKLITATGKLLSNSLLTYDAGNNIMYTVDLKPQEQTVFLAPSTLEELADTNYEVLCGSSPTDIDADIFNQLINANNFCFVDVRNENEWPMLNEFVHFKIPLPKLIDNLSLLDKESIVLFCQSGKRSREAVVILQKAFGSTKKIYSLKGGIEAWKQLIR